MLQLMDRAGTNMFVEKELVYTEIYRSYLSTKNGELVGPYFLSVDLQYIYETI